MRPFTKTVDDFSSSRRVSEIIQSHRLHGLIVCDLMSLRRSMSPAVFGSQSVRQIDLVDLYSRRHIAAMVSVA